MNLMNLATKLIAAARTAAWLALLVAPFCTAFGQGSLMPVGPPAPTMKTLAQIEARTPISSAPFTINQSGSYYLTNNLTVSSGDAITIASSGVTLDLNGFAISSTAPTVTGIAIRINTALQDLVIQNGFILSGVTNTGGTYSGPGFANGIMFVHPQNPKNVRVTNVTVTGCRFNGIYLAGESTLVESCIVRTVGGIGFWAGTLRSSSATDCGGIAILGELISDCRGENTGSADAIRGFTVQNCSGYSVSGIGISAQSAQNSYGNGGDKGVSAWTALGCFGQSGNGTGLYAESTAENCHGYSYGDAPGVWALSAQNCRGFSNSGRGVFAETAENCYGASASGVGGAGIFADIAQNCRGFSSNGVGISATTALNCIGYTNTSIGLFCVTAQNCQGYTTTGGTGLSAQKSAQNCYGSGGYGIQAGQSQGGVATNCHGVSTGNGSGLLTDIAIGCYGSSPNGPGIVTIIANCCRGIGSPIGVSASFKYNMP